MGEKAEGFRKYKKKVRGLGRKKSKVKDRGEVTK